MKDEIKNERDYDFCPFCNTDMSSDGLTYVEVGCTNYLNYIKNKIGEWEIFDEVDGENANDAFYACKSCGQKLPDDYQEHFGDNI